MLIDATALSDEARLEADVCIVGAGPVGASLAAELASSSLSVVVLESGALGIDPTAQHLNEAGVSGDPYDGLEKSRHRQVGGASRLWNMPLAKSQGAKFIPLDPIDFRAERGRPGWPIEFSELEPHYRRAQIAAGLGRFSYDVSTWDLPPPPIPADDPIFVAGMYHFGVCDPYCRSAPEALAAGARTTLCHSATVKRLRWSGSRCIGVEAVTANGRKLTIYAGWTVLAAGGVENPRILLVEQAAGCLTDPSGWLGRGFMEHPRDYTICLEPESRRDFARLEFFDTHRIEGAVVGGRIALRAEAIAAHDLPNASISLLPKGRSLRPFHWRIESLAWSRWGWWLQWPPGYGWSRLPTPARRFAGFQVLINLEELPHPDNRLTLDPQLDRHGVPRARLTRRWHAADAQRLARLRGSAIDALQKMDLGSVRVGPSATPDPNSHHHLGATRMGADPATGVTDPHGRVFAADNLCVVGGSLFPCAGFANPTLTAIALALRTADWLRSNA